MANEAVIAYKYYGPATRCNTDMMEQKLGRIQTWCNRDKNNTEILEQTLGRKKDLTEQEQSGIQI